MAFDTSGKYVYVADSGNHVIRKITVATTRVETFAGSAAHGWAYQDGFGTNARFGSPWGLAIHDIEKANNNFEISALSVGWIMTET